MKPETSIRLDEVQHALNQAQNINDGGEAPGAIEKAYMASNQIAAAYMSEVEGRDLPANDDIYYLFSRTVEEPGRHPEFIDRITDVVRDVYILHEAYEPALLAKTNSIDAQQMIDHVQVLRSLIEDILR